MSAPHDHVSSAVSSSLSLEALTQLLETIFLRHGTSAEVARNRLGDMVLHQYVPLDLLPCIRRFLDYWQPDAAIGVESEIWPATLSELRRRHIPQILVNARMSDRSFDRWKRHPAIAETR